MLPYVDPSALLLVLQDFDVVVEANRSTGLLVSAEVADGVLKTRMAGEVMESLGFRTRLVERRFDDSVRPGADEPTWALAGFDQPNPRAALGVFDFAVDVGLGAAADDYLGIHLHTFPAAGDPAAVFPSARGVLPEPHLEPWAIAAAGDRCGVLQLQGAAVGAAFVGAVAAATALAEVLRVLAGGTPTAVASMSLDSTGDVDFYRPAGVNVTSPGFVRAR